MIGRRALLVPVVAAAAIAALGCMGARSADRPAASVAVSPADALRTCVDRWNQANMRGWGPAEVRVAVRRLTGQHLAAAGLLNSAMRRCVVSVAFEFRKEQGRCEGGVAVPAKPGWCVDRGGTFDCALERFGAYSCPVIHEPLRPPLTSPNGTTDARGVLTLRTPLKGTHAAAPLAWHRYPHTDGYIEPWASGGKLRRGLRFKGLGHGPCGGPSELVFDTAAFRCRSGSSQIVDPCFPPTRGWRTGDVAACARWPGDTAFVRWRITGRL